MRAGGELAGLVGLAVGLLSVIVGMWAFLWLLDGLRRGVVGTAELVTLSSCIVAGGVGFRLWDRAVGE